MVPKNRLNQFREAQRDQTALEQVALPPGVQMSTLAYLYESAWRDAERDVQLDRLFNSWYYEI